MKTFFLFIKRLSYIFFVISILSLTKPNLLEQNLQKLPTLRLTINSKSLEDIEKIFIKQIIKEMQIPIDDIIISEDIDFLGKLDFILKNTIIKITNSTDAELFLVFAEKKNVSFVVNILNSEITFDYDFRTELISSSGNGTIYVKNISLYLNNTIIQVPNKHEPEKMGPGLNINGVLFNDLEIEMIFSKKGTFEKLLKYVNKNLKDSLLKLAEYQFNNNDVMKEINSKLYDLFEIFNLNIPIENLLNIDDNLNISFSMNEEPFAKNNNLELSFEAELIGEHYIYNETNNINLPDLLNNSDIFVENKINGIISQFILNNILDVLYFYGKLNVEIKGDTIGMTINVGMISGFIPEIVNNNYTQYKAAQEVKIITNAIDNPILRLHDKNVLKINLNENLKFFVFNETDSLDEDIGTIPIDANSELEIEANFYFNDYDDIQLTLKSVSMISFEVIDSLIGPIDTENVIKKFNSYIPTYLIFINNNIKKKIQELPKPFIIQEIILNDLVIQSFEEYLKFDLSPIISNLTSLFLN